MRTTPQIPDTTTDGTPEPPQATPAPEAPHEPVTMTAETADHGPAGNARPDTGSGDTHPSHSQPRHADVDHARAARRWRLVLGRYADHALTCSPEDSRLDGVLGYLYDRSYSGRGHRLGRGPGSSHQGGTLDSSALRTVDWLNAARDLFPTSTLERMESDALTRYGMTELLADPTAVESIEASPALGAALLRHKGRIPPHLADGLRVIITKVVQEAVDRLRPPLTAALSGSRTRRRSPHASARNFDWRATIGANLKNIDPATGRILVEDLRFVTRQRRRNLSWEVIVLVDQSGSMAQSLIHSAVTASILAGLPGVSVRLIAFDTSVVDLSHLVHDPVEVLMTCQLGGGTDIARAVAYAAQQVRQPTRTVVALVSDFDEGGSVSALVAQVASLAAAGVRTLGLASMTDDGQVWFNRAVAERVAEAGMTIGAMSPDRFATWLAEVMA